ncbi:MAG: YigZ family protein, partial [Firmicutes bacterium]|nr:YigZ family protein [Bacillota bacterium]
MKLFEGEAYIEKSSKFYGYFFDVNSVQEFKQILDDLKKKHKGAGHFCYGYRIEESTCGEQESMFDEKVLSEKKSDDGEP